MCLCQWNVVMLIYASILCVYVYVVVDDEEMHVSCVIYIVMHIIYNLYEDSFTSVWPFVVFGDSFMCVTLYECDDPL